MNIPSVSSWSNLSEISDASVEDIENRTEDEISSLTKSILNSAHSDFRTTILNGKLGSDLISKSLGDSSFDVRHAALSYACASLSSDEVSESDKEKIFVSFSKYFEENADTCSVRESDLLRAGLACLFCYFSGCYSEKDPKRQAAFHKIVLVMDTLRDEGCILVGKSLAILVRSVSYETASELCELSMRSSLDCSKSLQRRRSAAAITSAIIKGLGQTCALRMTMVDNLRNIFNDENGEIAQLACGFNLYSSVCMIAGRSFEPFMFEFSPLIFCAFSNASAEVRDSARIAQASIASSLHNNTITFITPALVQGLTHKSWQNKVRSLVFMGDLSTRAPGFFKRSIPDIFGPLLECVFDTHPKVSASALSILRPICESVTNAELLGMLDLILLAIQYPQNKTEECLDKLMETTFVNSMDAPSLAIILPIILRGLRERAKELKQKAATTCGNICALVDDTRDLLPFISILLPELNKCEEHSHPDLRKCAVKAKESLLKGLDDQNLKGGKSSSSYICDALEASSIKIDPVVLTHVARVGGWMLTVAPLRMPPNILSQDICRELFSILEDSLDYALIEKVAEDAVLAYKGLEASSLNDAAPKDYIVELEGIILAFAGRVLLQRTDFVLERGHTYGIVGQNGTGKTTLLNRVAKKDISNFPQDVSVYYIQHEILSEKQETVIDFMLSSVRILSLAK
jgi:elongation factor 3